MIFLLFSILSSAGIFLIFKYFERWKVDTFQAIVYNYIAAFIMGLFAISIEGDLNIFFTKDWHIYPFLLGFMFVGLFYIIAITAQKMGVSVASIATKMSLVIAVGFFVIMDPEEQLTSLDVVAIILAVAGVFLASIKNTGKGFSTKWILLPVVIFLGSGLLDITIGIFSSDEYLVHDSDHYLIATLPFAAASGFGIVIQIYRMAAGKSKFHPRNLWAGLLLGVVNFCSIFFLVRVLNSDVLELSAIIPINNMGIVVLSALLSLLIFGEKLSLRNWAGVLCSVVAIGLLLL